MGYKEELRKELKLMHKLVKEMHSLVRVRL